MSRWLSDYSYRISLSPWIFIAAGAFCLLVSFVSVYWQSRQAAHANPVNSLQSE
jgi:putative ABC transport system permease protein